MSGPGLPKRQHLLPAAQPRGGKVTEHNRVLVKTPFAALEAGRRRMVKVDGVARLYLDGTAERASWVYRFKIAGKVTSLSLGQWPEIGLEAASALADACSVRIAAGERRELVVPSRVSLAEAAEAYRLRRPWQRAIANRIGQFLSHCGKLARRPVAEVTVDDFQAIVDRIARRSPSSAEAFAKTARALINEARRTRLTRAHMVDLKAPAVPSRRAYFDRQGIAEILAVLPAMDWRFHAGTLFQLATGCRQGEAFSLEWRDLDLPRRRWLAPAVKMKNGLFHALWLNDTALRALDLARQQSGRNRGFVFSRDPAAEWTAYRAAKARFKRAIGWPAGERLVFHDFRRSLRALPQVDGQDSAIGDMILSHARREGRATVDASYNVRRHDAEVQAYLAAWDAVLKECQALAEAGDTGTGMRGEAGE